MKYICSGIDTGLCLNGAECENYTSSYDWSQEYGICTNIYDEDMEIRAVEQVLDEIDSIIAISINPDESIIKITNFLKTSDEVKSYKVIPTVDGDPSICIAWVDLDDELNLCAKYL